MATVTLQRLPQDVSAAHDRCHGDKPWQFCNDMIVYGTKIVLRSVKPIGVAYKLNLITNWIDFLIGQPILEVTFSIRLGPLR